MTIRHRRNQIENVLTADYGLIVTFSKDESERINKKSKLKGTIIF